MSETVQKPLVEVAHLNVDFMVKRDRIHVVDDVTFHIDEGEVLAVIGETGCGKSVTGNALLHLLAENALCDGSIKWRGQETIHMSDREFRPLRGTEIMSVAQNPVTSLDPLMEVGIQVGECLTYREAAVSMEKSKLRSKVESILKGLKLGGEDGRYSSYPCELSGGMCQRVLLAMGIISHPRLFVADEPTKAIDWVLRKSVVETLVRLNKEEGITMFVITHDIPFARLVADRVMVMYAGEIVEVGPTNEVLAHPCHPYTKGLLDSAPERGFKVMEGHMPSFVEKSEGCRFAPRCPFADAACAKRPGLAEVAPGRTCRCFHPVDEAR